MGYCSITAVTKILAKALTTYTPSSISTPGNLLNVGNSLNTNQVQNSDINYYIALADSHINSSLSQQYQTPLIEICDLETTLSSDIDSYSDSTNVSLTLASPLVPGDILVFTDGTNTESSEVEEVTGNVVTLSSALYNTFSTSETRVLRVRFPDPIPFISARLTAATLYEKYFSAQSSPNNSDYFKSLRAMSLQELNNIREGRTILHGAVRIGTRFYNPNLDSRYGVASFDTADGTRSDEGSKA
jgi:hypothetical protein